MYLGCNSIWIMDGARIHCHRDIVTFFRSIGVVPIFLPVYCPFFNPIETFFAIVKARMRREYEECTLTTATLPIKIMEVMTSLRRMYMGGVFAKCGHEFPKCFDLRAYRQELWAGEASESIV